MFVALLSVCIIEIFGESLASYVKRPTKCVSLNNRPYKARPTIVNINSNQPLFYPFTRLFQI